MKAHSGIPAAVEVGMATLRLILHKVPELRQQAITGAHAPPIAPPGGRRPVHAVLPPASLGHRRQLCRLVRAPELTATPSFWQRAPIRRGSRRPRSRGTSVVC